MLLMNDDVDDDVDPSSHHRSNMTERYEASELATLGFRKEEKGSFESRPQILLDSKYYIMPRVGT